jgi:hypothetical protein
MIRTKQIFIFLYSVFISLPLKPPTNLSNTPLNVVLSDLLSGEGERFERLNELERSRLEDNVRDKKDCFGLTSGLRPKQ